MTKTRETAKPGGHNERWVSGVICILYSSLDPPVSPAIVDNDASVYYANAACNGRFYSAHLRTYSLTVFLYRRIAKDMLMNCNMAA